MLRRLLKRLEQCIERRLRQHVDLVHDVHLVAPGRGPVVRGVCQAPHIVDPGVTRAVDLQDVEMAFSERVPARRALAAGTDRRLVATLAIQPAGDDARRCRLAHAAHTDKEERVRDPPLLECVGQGLYQDLLPEQVVECGRPVFPRQNPVRGGGFTARIR